MAESEEAANAVEACCSEQFCTCKKTPNVPCGIENANPRATLESINAPKEDIETANDLDTSESTPAQVEVTNLGSDKCSSPEQLCCTCGKPIRSHDNSQSNVKTVPEDEEAAEDTIIIETTIDISETPLEDTEPNHEDIGCVLEDCDKEFCASQNLPCDKVEEEPATDDQVEPTEASEEKRPSEIETSETPAGAKCNKKNTTCSAGRSQSQAEPTEGGEIKSESADPVAENPTGTTPPCCCKAKKEDSSPPEE